ncbi:hypothetical protein [Castellaniella denitrificans]|uniref:Uncharacterized protein n=1 Tax=Castellaniella denitrificans TaxID=56119 RepID=A0ABT4M605_9BURK|nr:hypothetical protein [Castellaniella denitrificans]MCZ4330759.1 hypothetical protein [Castellaniella denitrificans]
MTGHQPLIAMRLEGYCPAGAFVTVIETAPTWGPYTHPDRAMENGGSPDIVILPEDNPATVDLRCLRGMVVQIHGNDHARTVAALERISQFEPAKAIAAGEWGLRAWKSNRGFFDL